MLPRLASGYYVLESEDEVVLRRVDGHRVDVRSSLPGKALWHFLQSLDGTRTVGELAAEHGLTVEFVERTLEDLRRVGALIEHAPRGPLALYLSHLLHAPADQVQEAVLNGDITVVGPHPLGGELIRALSLDGVRRIRWLDVHPDRTEASEEMDSLQRLIPEMEIARGSPGDLEALLERSSACDLIVVGHEGPDPAVDDAVNQFAVSRGVRWMRLEIVGPDVILGPTVLPGQTACWECLRNRRLGHVTDPKVHETFEQSLRDTPARRPFGYSWSLLMLAAALAAGEVLRLLIEPFCERPILLPHTYGTQIVVSSLRGEWQAHHVLRLPRCRVCGRGRAEDVRVPAWVATDVSSA